MSASQELQRKVDLDTAQGMGDGNGAEYQTHDAENGVGCEHEKVPDGDDLRAGDCSHNYSVLFFITDLILPIRIPARKANKSKWLSPTWHARYKLQMASNMLAFAVVSNVLSVCFT